MRREADDRWSLIFGTHGAQSARCACQDRRTSRRVCTERVFAACALALAPGGTFDDIAELVADQLTNMRHLYMDFETKEQTKRTLEFQNLPFAAVYDGDGRLVCKGDPTTVEFDAKLKEFLRKHSPVIHERAAEGR